MKHRKHTLLKTYSLKVVATMALAFSLLASSYHLAHAQVYRWVDSDGVTHYSSASKNDKPARGSLAKQQGVSISRSVKEESPFFTNATRLLVAPNCGQCDVATDWLNNNGIRFIKFDILSSKAAADDFRKHSDLIGQSKLPMLITGGSAFVDFYPGGNPVAQRAVLATVSGKTPGPTYLNLPKPKTVTPLRNQPPGNSGVTASDKFSNGAQQDQELRPVEPIVRSATNDQGKRRKATSSRQASPQESFSKGRWRLNEE